ncbi:MAG TPA: hypothetical protein VE685_21175 [Thermoanaerobaculia bacterium]|nr:hypothetical protein [Thermoanaerobaculia bacterium]
MKKMVLGLSLALAALGFLMMSPAVEAADSPQTVPRALSAADQAFLASLAAPAKPAAAPAPAAKRPSGLEKALCSATARCWDGTTRRCDGNNSATSCTAVDSVCPTQRGYVTCDGGTQFCPECPTPGGCPSTWCTDQDEQNCAAGCFPCDYTFTCSSTNCTESCRCNFRTCPV